MDELVSPIPGTSAALTIVTVDEHGNRVTSSDENANFSISLTGPAAAPGAILSNGDGTYAIKYLVPVEGDYTLSLKMGDQPICLHGGKDCCDEKKSALQACSTLQLPKDPSGKCRFCLKVRDLLLFCLTKHHANTLQLLC